MTEKYSYTQMLEQILAEVEGTQAMTVIALKYPHITEWQAMRKQKAEITARNKLKKAEETRLAQVRVKVFSKLAKSEQRAVITPPWYGYDKSLNAIRKQLVERLTDDECHALNIGKYSSGHAIYNDNVIRNMYRGVKTHANSVVLADIACAKDIYSAFSQLVFYEDLKKLSKYGDDDDYAHEV